MKPDILNGFVRLARVMDKSDDIVFSKMDK